MMFCFMYSWDMAIWRIRRDFPKGLTISKRMELQSSRSRVGITMSSRAIPLDGLFIDLSISLSLSEALLCSLCVAIGVRCYSWGCNNNYQCGDGMTTSVSTPKLIDSLKDIDVVDVQAGAHHNVARSSNHDFHIWGFNSNGECMTGNTKNVRISAKLKPAFTNNAKEQIVSLWPGYCTTRVIVRRKGATKMLNEFQRIHEEYNHQI